MNKEQQLQSYQEIQEYLHRNNAYQILQDLLQETLVQKPKNVIEFLIKKLEAPEKKTWFVVGPPGLSMNDIFKHFPNDKNIELFNCGSEISKIHENLSENSKKMFESGRLIENKDIEEKLVKKIENVYKSSKSFIITSYPKNLVQAISLQSHGIYPKHVIFININDEGLASLCQKNISHRQKQNNEKHSHNNEESGIAHAMAEEYKIHLRELKRFYKNYIEIDISKDSSTEYVRNQLMTTFDLKVNSPLPRINSQIIIIGSPLSGRTTLGKKIAEHYNFVYISTAFLIAEEIRKDTIHGRKIKENYQNNQLVDLFLLSKMIEDRISKKDCKMQGFVLEGFPKNTQQFESLKNLKIEPTLIVAIDAKKEKTQNRDNNAISFDSRHQRWVKFNQSLKIQAEHKILYVNAELHAESMYQEVRFEFQKKL